MGLEVVKLAAELFLVTLSGNFAGGVMPNQVPVLAPSLGLAALAASAMTSVVGSLMVHGGATVAGVTVPTGTTETTVLGLAMACGGLCLWIEGYDSMVRHAHGVERAATTWP